MTGRNPAPWILTLTVAAAGVAFYLADKANPDDVSGRKAGTAALIVIGAGIAFMVIVQRFWIRHQRRAARRATIQAAYEAAAAGHFDDPAKFEPTALLVAMATEPVDPEQLADAGDAAWGVAEGSQASATTITLMIVVLMIPAIITQNINLIVYASIPIVLYAVFLAARVLLPGGTFDQAYDAADDALAPLGLQSVERPDIAFQPRLAGEGLESKIVGRTVLEGRRFGRDVRVTIAGSKVETVVRSPAPPFELAGHRQRVKPQGGGEPPPAVADVLGRLGASTNWTGMKLKAGPDGIVVTRKSAKQQGWLYDLWLAERIADALSPARATS